LLERLGVKSRLNEVAAAEAHAALP
jgi:hypothetical protein